MLETLPAAQAAGQKSQEDAQLGQGSIFDFGEAGEGEGATRASVQRPPVPAAEFVNATLSTKLTMASGQAVVARGVKTESKSQKAQTLVIVAARLVEADARGGK